MCFTTRNYRINHLHNFTIMNNTKTKTLTAGLMHGLKGSPIGTHDVYRLKDCSMRKNIALSESYGELYLYTIWIHNEGTKDQVVLSKGTIKPYLFPMSSLTKDIEVKGERFVPMQVLFGSVTFWKNYIDKPLSEWEHSKVEWLIEHHFNVFGLSPEEFIEVNETNNPYK